MNNVAREMKHLHTLAQRAPGKRFTRLWRSLTSEVWLIQAWEHIRRNTGNRTPGPRGTRVDDVDLGYLRQLSRELRGGQYRPTPVRRTYIPKGNGKLRPLGIPDLKDKIVQQALRMLLEPIFEADFRPCSHGFRQGRSPHTALREVAERLSKTSWTIEGDIQGCFDNFSHGKLMAAISRRIADAKVLGLLKAFLTAGYLEAWVYHKTYSGTPQGAIVSPLLCNVFLHQLDEYMENELKANVSQTGKDVAQRRNPVYQKITKDLMRYRGHLRGNPSRAARRALLQTIRALEKQQKQTPVYVHRHRTTLGYARYADDFVILINGPKQAAVETRDTVKAFLATLGLALSEDKTKLTHWSKPVAFLGYHIRGEMKAKGVQLRAILEIPQEKVRHIRREIQKVATYHHIPEVDAIQTISAQFRGWCQYYRYAHNASRVGNRLASQVWWYTAYYLARKHRMRLKPMLTWAQKVGRYKVVTKGEQRRRTFTICVGQKEYVLDVFPPKPLKIQAIRTQQDWHVDLKPVNPAAWQQGRSTQTRVTALARSGGRCERCHTHLATTVHHRNRMKRKHTLRARVASDAAQRATAMALCPACHLAMHHGQWRDRA